MTQPDGIIAQIERVWRAAAVGLMPRRYARQALRRMFAELDDQDSNIWDGIEPEAIYRHCLANGDSEQGAAATTDAVIEYRWQRATRQRLAKTTSNDIFSYLPPELQAAITKGQSQ